MIQGKCSLKELLKSAATRQDWLNDWIIKLNEVYKLNLEVMCFKLLHSPLLFYFIIKIWI